MEGGRVGGGKKEGKKRRGKEEEREGKRRGKEEEREGKRRGKGRERGREVLLLVSFVSQGKGSDDTSLNPWTCSRF